jgi:hypothetical protein
MADQEWIDKVAKAKEVPIEYLLGHPVSREVLGGQVKKYSSPFSSDSDPSFTIFPGNSYYDFANGTGGDVITLKMKLGNLSFMEAVNELIGNISTPLPTVPAKGKNKEFKLQSYLTLNKEEQVNIEMYAKSRKIFAGYEAGLFYTKDKGNWVRHPGMLFVHRDEQLNAIGAKIRVLPGDTYNDRFTARGKLGVYVLEHILVDHYSEPTLYIVEGESTANSLWEFCKSQNISAVVLSGGGVASPPKFIPDAYEKYRRRIIIDYDGDKEKYAERCKLYEHLEGEHIKLVLPKGEDVNSLWAKGKADLLLNLIL